METAQHVILDCPFVRRMTFASSFGIWIDSFASIDLFEVLIKRHTRFVEGM